MKQLSFNELGLSEQLLETIQKEGYTTPTPIQQQVIPLLLDGKDVIGQAHTGTGKTAAFGLPIIDLLLQNPGQQVLILAPVRELALQVAKELARFTPGRQLRVATIYGGESYQKQIKAFKEGVEIIVATPGRLIDLIDTDRTYNFSPTIAVIDEADEMLDMGFLDDVKKILRHFEELKQKLLFSATMPDAIKSLAKSFLNQPVHVHVASEGRTNTNITQYYSVLFHEDKDDALVRIMLTQPYTQAIVFCNTKKEVDRIVTLLQGHKIFAVALHGDLEQRQRQHVIELLRKGVGRVMIATEVAARGLDFEGITHVINYDLPFNAECYIHRIGRTGRAGKEGAAISFVTPRETGTFERICKQTKSTAEKLKVPSKQETKESYFKTLLTRISKTELTKIHHDCLKSLLDCHSHEELSLMLLAQLFDESSIPGKEDLNLASLSRPSGRGDRSDRPERKGNFFERRRKPYPSFGGGNREGRSESRGESREGSGRSERSPGRSFPSRDFNRDAPRSSTSREFDRDGGRSSREGGRGDNSGYKKFDQKKEFSSQFKKERKPFAAKA